MSADVPLFALGKNKGDKGFIKANKDDIAATINFLYQRGMWSKFHYVQWMNQLKKMDDAEMLHLWWDAITGGAMFEVDSPKIEALEAKTEAMEEMAEEKVEMKYGKKMDKKKMK